MKLWITRRRNYDQVNKNAPAKSNSTLLGIGRRWAAWIRRHDVHIVGLSFRHDHVLVNRLAHHSAAAAVRNRRRHAGQVQVVLRQPAVSAGLRIGHRLLLLPRPTERVLLRLLRRPVLLLLRQELREWCRVAVDIHFAQPSQVTKPHLDICTVM